MAKGLTALLGGMMTATRCRWGWLLWVWIAASASGYATPQRAPDHLKAAYLFNIAKLVEWPADVLPGPESPLIFCTSASDSLTQELRKLASKPIAQRRIQVVALGARNEAHFCHLVFVGQDRTGTWFRHHAKPVTGQLVIGEHDTLLGAGGVINLYLDRERLRFEVSLANAQAVGVRISSRLLKLARIVDQPATEGGRDD